MLCGATGLLRWTVGACFRRAAACCACAGGARRGPTLRECVLMHAVARLALHPHITNIQASWVKMGPQRAAQLLAGECGTACSTGPVPPRTLHTALAAVAMHLFSQTCTT